MGWAGNSPSMGMGKGNHMGNIITKERGQKDGGQDASEIRRELS